MLYGHMTPHETEARRAISALDLSPNPNPDALIEFIRDGARQAQYDSKTADKLIDMARHASKLQWRRIKQVRGMR